MDVARLHRLVEAVPDIGRAGRRAAPSFIRDSSGGAFGGPAAAGVTEL